MVGNTVETATTYEPFGKLLVQSGSSGTVYGYTGEQYDVATSLVYLRARYYNPNLKVFMSRDPFPGWAKLPASQHPYSYVHNNPVNLTDPSGNCVFGGVDTLICGGIALGAFVIYVAWDALVDVSSEIGQVAGGIYDRAADACKTAVTTLTDPAPEEERDRREIDSLPRTETGETFYRFIPTSKALSVTARNYSKLLHPIIKEKISYLKILTT